MLNGRSKSKPEIVVVTGASAGVGRAIVREFAKERAWIGLIARGQDGLKALAGKWNNSAAADWFYRLMSPTRQR